MKILFLGPQTLKTFKWLKSQPYEIKQTEEKLFSYDSSLKEFDLVVSHNYRHILKPEIFEQFKRPAVNIHTSLLPWNRGSNPNFWSWYDGTPKGVTIHEIDKGLDTGKILGFCEITNFGKNPTLATSYDLLQEVGSRMFIQMFPELIAGNLIGKNPEGKGTYHRASEMDQFKDLLALDGWHTKCAKIEEAGKLART